MTIITQTRVLPERNDDFARWQQHVSDVVARFPGFRDHQVIPPQPPAQVDWVVVQKFDSSDHAQAWLRSKERLHLIETVQPMLVGHDDIHVVEGDGGQPPEAVSAVISVKVVPGQETPFREWEQRIATAETQYAGFQGHKTSPPLPGVHDDWVTILTFDNEPHLDAWLTSPEREKFLAEATPFTSDTHYRKVRSGFEQWFRVEGGAAPPAAWKQNMLVLAAIYPVVFLFGFFVGTPLLSRQLGWPFWLSLFAGNVASVVILNWLVPWISNRFGWWLHPTGSDKQQRTLLGVAIVIAVYALSMLIFSRFP